MNNFIYMINNMMNSLMTVYVRDPSAWFMALPLAFFVAERLYRFFRRMFV